MRARSAILVTAELALVMGTVPLTVFYVYACMMVARLCPLRHAAPSALAWRAWLMLCWPMIGGGALMVVHNNDCVARGGG